MEENDLVTLFIHMQCDPEGPVYAEKLHFSWDKAEQYPIPENMRSFLRAKGDKT